MNRTPLFQAATAALLLSLGCSPDDLAHEDSTTPTPEPAPTPDTPDTPDTPGLPASPPHEAPGSPGAPCRLDADCGPSTFCELRICIAGCVDDSTCTDGELCTPHGRCEPQDDEAAPKLPYHGAPALTDRTTVLAFNQTEARTTLRNDSPEPLTYRLEATNPALTLDTALAELAPGAEVELLATVDLTALTPNDHILPIQIFTSGGAVLWSLQIDALPESGNFRGAVSFDADGTSLASSDLTLDLDFRDDGTIAGRIDTAASLLWPQPLAITGTWNPAGDISLTLRDRLPAEDWHHSPLARELGRELVLTGKRTPAGLEGTATERITGLRDAPVQISGAFAFHRQGPLTGIVLASDNIPKDAIPPTWLAPPTLDNEACDDLGTTYGTDQTLPEPSPACDTCATGTCSPEDMMDCSEALRAAAHNIDDVLAALHSNGKVKPPSGQWTWDDCTADPSAYNDDGLTCLDMAALRCADALARRGSEQTPGEWSEAYAGLAAVYAGDEAIAASLLSTESQVDTAFSFKNAIGEPATGAFDRELSLLITDRDRLAAALAPTLSPGYLAGLAWLEDHNVHIPTAGAHLAPLQLTVDFARTTAQWARLAHRAGKNSNDVRAAVQLTALALHAAAAELHTRLADNPDATTGLHALGSALQLLGTVHAELAPDASTFGYSAAYVPLALGPEDIAHNRSNFDAVSALATDEISQFNQIAADAWQKARDYEEKTHTLDATALQIETEYDSKLRALCGSLPGETTPALANCGEQGGQIAELRAAAKAAGLRIQHASQAAENNLNAIHTEQVRFAHVVEIALHLTKVIDEAHDRIFTVKDHYGKEHSVLEQAAATAECARIRDNARAEADVIETGCDSAMVAQMTAGPAIFGFATPNIAGMAYASKECEAKKASLRTATENQCASVLNQAGLQSSRDQLQREEDLELMTINAEIDQAIRESDIEVQRVASIALIENIRAEGLLLQIETEEAILAQDTAVTNMLSAYKEAAVLIQERARTVGLMIDDSPDNALTRPHFLQARLEAAGRVLPARERAIRRVYLALRALEYEINQELPALRDTLAAARSPEDITSVMSCLGSIAEDYRLENGYGQPYVTEVSLRADIFGMTTDIPDIDGSPATPAEQFAALLQDPMHGQPDGSIALPFALSAFEHTLFSTSLCDDRIDQIEVKLIGDYLGDKEAEVILTRQGLAGMRRCDGADLPNWTAYVPYEFDREQIVIQAGVNDWGTGGPNAGYAAWPVHGEQWTLTIPSPSVAPANLDIDLRNISDVVLRLHHRAGTIAPAGQGTFTPSCG